MTQTESPESTLASVEEIQQGWHELTLRVSQLETEKGALEKENKTLRTLLERVIEHRQKSHSELVLLLSGLVSKLPINDVGVVVSKLVEHNTHVGEVCAAMAKGNVEAGLPQMAVLKALDQTKRDLSAAVKPAVEELIRLDTSLDSDLLRSLIAKPDLFISPAMGRANRCFNKGHVLRERIVKDFGAESLIFFNDMTTDPKLNPRPKPEEITLAFKQDFEALFQQNTALLPGKRERLQALYEKIQRGKAPSAQARLQRSAFQELSFVLELLHYYENQNTESPEVVFAQRLPALIEQLVLINPQDSLEEKWILQAERLMAFVINPDHRQMIVNNVGKGGGTGKTLKFVFLLRSEKVSDPTQILPGFVKHLVSGPKAPPPAGLAAVMRLIHPAMQRPVVHALRECDRLRKEEAEALSKAVARELGLPAPEAPASTPASVPVEIERQKAWQGIKDLIVRRNEPAAIAAAIRDRVRAKYDAEEMKQSWVTLIEADPISLIRVFCQLPYLADGRTDPVARAVMETYVTRLTHEKYAATYHKIVSSLKNMFKANPGSPTLVNFLALVKWVNPEAANQLSVDIGRPIPAP